MKILIHLLRDGFPKAFRVEYVPKEMGVEFVDLTYLEPILFEGNAEKYQNTLTVRGHLTSRRQQTCARCLKLVEQPLDQPVELVYDISGKTEIDTTEEIREILILDHPIRYLCQETCEGLCPHCGADLNEAACSCPK